MKKPLLFLAAALLFAVNAAYAENPFEGSWELVSGEYVDAEGKLVDYANLKMESLKIISGNRYSFISMSGGKHWASSAGVFEFDRETYSESPVHASYPVESGHSYVFKYQIEGNLLHSSRWDGDKRVEYEVWKKIQWSVSSPLSRRQQAGASSPPPAAPRNAASRAISRLHKLVGSCSLCARNLG